MLKAHSLLYAVYICLIVSILCGALLYFANLYNHLNLFYNIRENLYIQNQSAVNYALGDAYPQPVSFLEESTGVTSVSETKSFGLLDMLIVRSFVGNDTIASTHFVGKYNRNKTCIYLSNFSEPLSFSGNVRLIGDKNLPSKSISQNYRSTAVSELTAKGNIDISDRMLPAINPKFTEVFILSTHKRFGLKDLTRKNDSVYYNSFLNEAIEIQVNGSLLNNVIIKGNFILHSNDSIVVSKNVVLEDVIVKAPKITIKDGFKGNLQLFATEKINVGSEVILAYPSVVCVSNTTKEKSSITIKEKSKIYGAIVLFGNPINTIDDNQIKIDKDTFLIGDIYCSGKAMLAGTVYGSVYTNRFFFSNGFTNYDNCLVNTEIDNTKRPSYFVSIPLFENKNSQYGILKKVL